MNWGLPPDPRRSKKKASKPKHKAKPKASKPKAEPRTKAPKPSPATKTSTKKASSKKVSKKASAGKSRWKKGTVRVLQADLTRKKVGAEVHASGALALNSCGSESCLTHVPTGAALLTGSKDHLKRVAEAISKKHDWASAKITKAMQLHLKLEADVLKAYEGSRS